MISRRRIAVAATGGVLAAALAAGGVALGGGMGGGGGGGDRAADLASALNKLNGTNLTAADITKAMQQALKDRLDADVTAGKLTQAQADAILKRAADGPPWGPGGPGRPGFGPRREVFTQVLARAATALSLTQDALKDQLHSGKSLAQIAQDKGVSRADLVAAIVAGLKAERPSLTDARANAIAGDIVDGTPPGPGRWGPGGPPPGGPPKAGVYAP